MSACVGSRHKHCCSGAGVPALLPRCAWQLPRQAHQGVRHQTVQGLGRLVSYCQGQFCLYLSARYYMCKDCPSLLSQLLAAIAL